MEQYLYKLNYYYFFKIANINEESRGYIVEKEEESENDDDPINKEYNKLKIENYQKDKKIRELENEYTEKISELLILVQMHCEIKTDMYEKFEEIGEVVEFN